LDHVAIHGTEFTLNLIGGVKTFGEIVHNDTQNKYNEEKDKNAVIKIYKWLEVWL